MNVVCYELVCYERSLSDPTLVPRPSLVSVSSFKQALQFSVRSISKVRIFRITSWICSMCLRDTNVASKVQLYGTTFFVRSGKFWGSISTHLTSISCGDWIDRCRHSKTVIFAINQLVFVLLEIQVELFKDYMSFFTTILAVATWLKQKHFTIRSNTGTAVG